MAATGDDLVLGARLQDLSVPLSSGKWLQQGSPPEKVTPFSSLSVPLSSGKWLQPHLNPQGGSGDHVPFSPLVIGEMAATVSLIWAHQTGICAFSPLVIGEMAATVNDKKTRPTHRAPFSPLVIGEMAATPARRSVDYRR